MEGNTPTYMFQEQAPVGPGGGVPTILPPGTEANHQKQGGKYPYLLQE